MATNLETLEGFFDNHLHFREPGDDLEDPAETIESGSKAGIANGVTDGAVMPNLTKADGTKIPIDNPAALEDQHDRINRTSWMNLGVNFLVWRASFQHLETVKNRVIGYKAFADWSTGGFNMPTPEERREATAKIPSGKIMELHAEGGTLVEMLGYGDEFGTIMHVLHISTRPELEAAYAAKLRRPGKVTIGVNPAYLRFNKDHRSLFEGHPAFLKVKPPLGTEEDQRALILGVQNGVIDTFELDHAAHLRRKKELPWDEAPFGLSGLDTVFPLLWTYVVEGLLTKERLVAMYSTNSRRIFKIPTSPGSFFQFDPNERFRVGPPYQSLSGWSPLEGQELQGKVIKTFSGGRCLYDRGEFLGQPEGRVILPTR
jgi:dihydroorotase-like cyclic amidohydrolase